MYVAPPLTSNFEAACLEKMPLVDRIANAYQSIRVTPDMPICSWDRSGRSCKHITVWTNGFLYTMSRESLEYLIENPDVAEQVCDNAKAFLLLCSGHDMRKKYFRDTSVWVAPRSYTSTAGALGADYTVCVISKKRGSVIPTLIVPSQTTCSPTSQLLLAELPCISTAFFGSSITERIMALFREQHKASHGNGNYIHLNPYLSDLFIAGFFGLRPLALTRASEEKTNRPYHVHFSVHWMPQNGKGPNEYMEDPSHELAWMLYPTMDYQKNGDMICEMDAVMKQPILDGHECVAKHSSYESAENMFVLLAFRWTVTIALCLAGAVGLDEDDILTDLGGDSESDISDEE